MTDSKFQDCLHGVGYPEPQRELFLQLLDLFLDTGGTGLDQRLRLRPRPIWHQYGGCLWRLVLDEQRYWQAVTLSLRLVRTVRHALRSGLSWSSARDPQTRRVACNGQHHAGLGVGLSVDCGDRLLLASQRDIDSETADKNCCSGPHSIVSPRPRIPDVLCR